MTVNQTQLAQLCGLSDMTIYRYRLAGMPSLGLWIGQGRPRLYDVESARLWMARLCIHTKLSSQVVEDAGLYAEGAV